MRLQVEEELKKPWWKRRYDPFGIIGQAIGVKQFNNPWMNYCSERVIKQIYDSISGVEYVKLNLGRHLSPNALNETMKKDTNGFFEYYGHWLVD